MAYTNYYFSFGVTQINYIKACINNDILFKIVVTKQQLLDSSTNKNVNLICLPLTNLQVKMYNHAKDCKSDLVLEFHFDQLKVIAKDNYDIDMKIKHEMIAIHLHKQRVRKNMKVE